MTGSLQVGATVNDGESVALDYLARWTTGPVQVAVDSKIAIKRVQVPNIDSSMPELWSTPQAKRSLLEVTWTKSHLSEDQHVQRFGPGLAWAWAANLDADQMCGARSLEAFSFEQAGITDNIDRAARATCSWLGRRCSHILAHDPVPRAKDLKFEAVPVAKKKTQKPGLNKRQQLLAATESINPNTGHKWVVTAKAKNLCIKCETCTLFVQQTDPVPLVEFVLQHPCRHRPAVPNESAQIDPSHTVCNLGHLWSCSRCKACYSVRAPAKGRLAKKCKGKEAKKERGDSIGSDSKSGFAALFFREGPGLPQEKSQASRNDPSKLTTEARDSQPRQDRSEPQSSHLGSSASRSVLTFDKKDPQPLPPTQETEEKVLSSAGKSARVSQPKSKASSSSKGVSDKQPKAQKNPGSKQPPQGTQSVLHFFKAKP